MTTPPTPSPSQPSQKAMELAKEVLTVLFPPADRRVTVTQEDIARLIDAHTAGLRREVEEARAEAKSLSRVIIATRQSATQAMDEIRKIVGAPNGSEDPSTKRAADYVGDLRAHLARLTAALEERGRDGVGLIAAERARQISKEGWTHAHDDFEHHDGALATAAGCYATLAGAQQKFGTPDVTKVDPPRQWPFEWQFWKPSNDEIKNLVRAGALIAAEIDRLQRAARSAARKEPGTPGAQTD